MKMNKSFQILVAILLLVGSALANNPEEASQHVAPLDRDDAAENLCLEFVRNEMASYILPDEIAEMVHRLREENPALSDLQLLKNALQAYERPIPASCPKLVEFVKKTEHDKDHCGYLNGNQKVAGQILRVLVKDKHISMIFFANEACERLENLQAVKENYQILYNKILEAYKQVIVPRQVEDLMNEVRERGMYVETSKSWRMKKLCAGLLADEQTVFEYLKRIYPRSEEKGLFKKMVYDKFGEDNDEIKDIYEPARFCGKLLDSKLPGQSATE